jgi:NAD(P)-dependent dehydrogenase (short-subunit alcohol dehydrogenase family)
MKEGEAAVPLPGTVGETAQQVTAAGGVGIAVQCDHRDDTQVEALFAQVKSEQGRLDILVNNAWAGYEGYVTGKHAPPSFSFWQKPMSYWDDNMDGLRWAFIASWLAVPLLLEHGGLIVNISNKIGDPGDPAYCIAKTGTDRLTLELAHQLRAHNVAVLSLYPGLVRTENILVNAQWFDMSVSESPLLPGGRLPRSPPTRTCCKRAGRASSSGIWHRNTVSRM